jgi:hypothetical protein
MTFLSIFAKRDNKLSVKKAEEEQPKKDESVRKPKKQAADFDTRRSSKQTKNEFIANCFVMSLTVDDTEAWRSYITSETIAVFVDSDSEMLGEEFFEEVARIRRSFPDLRFTWSKFKEVSPGVVTTSFLQAEGTHIGAPYGFGPYPPIAARGVKVKDPPIKGTVTIKDGKVVKWFVDGHGQMCGPPLFYTKIGGILV